jgi:hypothetical protein
LGVASSFSAPRVVKRRDSKSLRDSAREYSGERTLGYHVVMMMSPLLLASAMLAACGPEARAPSSVADAAVPVREPDAMVPPPVDAPVSPPADGAECEPCAVTAASGTFCGVQVSLTPYATGGPFGSFQSQPGTGASQTITMTLSLPINWVSVEVIDPDFDGNAVRAYDANDTMVSEFVVAGDGTVNVLTQEMSGTGGAGIVRVELVPAAADYVAYDELQIVPSGCAPIIL